MASGRTPLTPRPKVFETKGRPQFDPRIVHIKDAEPAFDLCAEVPAVASELAERFFARAIDARAAKTFQSTRLGDIGIANRGAALLLSRVLASLCRAGKAQRLVKVATSVVGRGWRPPRLSMTTEPRTIPTLEAFIRDQIERRGPITFAEFMRYALYDPDRGYYRATRSVVGTAGDFFTSVSATPMFGRLLVQVMEHYAAQLSARLPRVVHEFGAHRGQLRSDVRAIAPDVTYHSYESQDDWPAQLEGYVIANELLDALPFHRLKVVGGRWREQFVGLVDGQFSWVTDDLSHEELLEPLRDLPLEYMEGYSTEVSLGTRRWLETLAARLTCGLVFLFDYGHETEQYFAPHRTEGGLRTFHKHQRGDDPFADVGERDITCDVYFTDVVDTAQRLGFTVVEFTDQGRFFSRQVARSLRRLASDSSAGSSETPFLAAFSPEEVRGLMTLTHPAHLGLAFKVVVLSKGL